MRQMILLGMLALVGCQTAAEAPIAAPAAPSAADIERQSGYVRPTDAQAIAAAKSAVAAKLKDPESARFTETVRKTTPNLRGEPTDVVCGKINAKNSYGGYTGAKPFAYLVAAKLSVSAEDIAGPDVIRNMCPELLR